ncbi:MAG TPA: hypothetical protein VN374_01370 [Desulfitobacteriaceae bacterium]|nr:hypothetical protein [Desulfitobacteriaceae bacterium]
MDYITSLLSTTASTRDGFNMVLTRLETAGPGTPAQEDADRNENVDNSDNVAVIEEVYDIFLPEVPAYLRMWGRKVWLRDIEVGAKGKLIYHENGIRKIICLSRITNIKLTSGRFAIYTANSIYILRLLPCEP